MRSVQLLTKEIYGGQKNESQQQFLFVIQYNSGIVSLSLNDRKKISLLCDARFMVRRHLVRGHCDQIYYAESSGASDKIVKVEMHPTE